MNEEAAQREVGERLAGLRERIAAAARRVGREPDAVRIVGVCKRQPLERVLAAARSGVEILAENYIQEARSVIPAVAAALEGERPAPPWRLVGRLQRNKAGAAVQLFHAVDTVDREGLALTLDRRAREAGHRLDVCLQVNVSGEPQKAGVTPERLPELLALCAAAEGLRVVGLMTLPAAAADPEAVRPAFARLRELRDTLAGAPGGEALQELSMGMSGDFEVAVEEGATMVRLGTALFGERAARAAAGGGT